MPYDIEYDIWCIRWWQWLLSIPREYNPLTDIKGENCAQNQTDPFAWFLASTFVSNTSVDRVCKVSSEKSIFFPIVNALCTSAEYPNKSVTELVSLAKDRIVLFKPTNKCVEWQSIFSANANTRDFFLFSTH